MFFSFQTDLKNFRRRWKQSTHRLTFKTSHGTQTVIGGLRITGHPARQVSPIHIHWICKHLDDFGFTCQVAASVNITLVILIMITVWLITHQESVHFIYITCLNLFIYYIYKDNLQTVSDNNLTYYSFVISHWYHSNI